LLGEIAKALVRWRFFDVMTTAGRSLREFSNVLALLGIGVVFAVLDSKFLGARNLSLLMTEVSITAILALGMLVILLPGHVDLSVGSGVGLLGGVAAVLVIQQGWPAPLAMGVAVLGGVGLWLAMGTLIVREKMPAFIVTLGGLLLFKGLFWLVIQNSTIPVVAGGAVNGYSLLTTYYLPAMAGWGLAIVVMGVWIWTQWLGRRVRVANGLVVESGEMFFLRLFVTAQVVGLFVLVTNQYRGIPLPAVLLGVVALGVALVTQHTAFGRHLYAVGGNEEAARVSGVPMERVVIGAFGIMGAITALAGLMQTAYVGSSTTTVGELMELDAIAACVIGGVSLRGGRGSVTGVLFGALIMATLLNGMTLLSVAPEMKLMVRGAVLVLAVWVDLRLGRKTV
jgi:D-xylose transport system permease protein